MARAAISSANEASPFRALPLAQPRRGTRAQPLDRGADDDVRNGTRSAVPMMMDTKLM